MLRLGTRRARRQAQAIALYYIYDLAFSEIAATLGCAEGTVKAHLARGRTALALRFDGSARLRLQVWSNNCTNGHETGASVSAGTAVP